ncbi:MAG TPA: gliding motility-associated C-terminal domain-containing protein [Bacteroidia bacterium]|nr:gliding motility-associated C-terminal domain-containing protein [Bacteroidia bacterium]
MIFIFSTNANAQLVINAGGNKTICPGSSVSIGGSPTASGGAAPYNYLWTPSATLSSANVANPIATPTTNTTYYVTVIDSLGNRATDSVTVKLYPVAYMGAGRDTSVCKSQPAHLGNSTNSTAGGTTFYWSPSTYLNNTAAPNPTCNATSTITYTLVVTSTTCPPETTTVTVTIKPPPVINAGPDVTINEGTNVTLTGSGATSYTWTPSTNLSSPNTAVTQAEPIVTTEYILYGEQDGCVGSDTIIVKVIPETKLVIYNTFTPNNDGVNDTWFIGNIWQYPNNVLNVYNRYGKLVYHAENYQNSWKGEGTGNTDLPAATYYYILDPGDGSAKYHGSVTIIR